ncbi:hypothetical protein UPYG_G00065320 [Umbra pygmaea]|uniref:NACHT domain-containing protein n=1 Tax=Umbra pygmaea TaxID=75934 RepID=A0ABD0XAA2_UMBPY
MFCPGKNLTDQRTVTDSHVGILCSKLKSILKKSYRSPPGGKTEHPFYIDCDLQYQACESSEVNQHEYILIDPGYSKRCETLYPFVHSEVDQLIKTALTIGVSGIGKSVTMQRFILNWAEGKGYPEVQLIFPLPFRQLNLVKDRLNLIELLYRFFPELMDPGISDLESCRVGFIFDGLDEFRSCLDFKNNLKMTDVKEAVCVSTLLTNLIAGNILPSAHIWITSRPAAVSRIPSQYINEVTEIKGFSDVQKEEFFRRAIRDKNQAEAVITYLKASKLYDLCRIPSICSIVASVLEKKSNIYHKKCEPFALTPFYDVLLHSLTKNVNIVDKMGKLAFMQLMKGITVLYEEDLRECNVEFHVADVCTDLKLPIFREDVGLHQTKMYYFAHTTIQEFFAAKWIIQSNGSPLCNINLKTLREEHLWFFPDACHLKRAVDKTLQSQTGHLDLFLRFLLGISQTVELFSQYGCPLSTALPEILEYIKEKVMENPASPRTLNLLNCMRELKDDSLTNMAMAILTKKIKPGAKYPRAHWLDLATFLMAENNPKNICGIELNISRDDKQIHRLLPIIKASKTASLKYHNLTVKSCEVFATVLSSKVSFLRGLDLSFNTLKDTGVQLLADGLAEPHCRLERLKLSGCRVKQKGFAALGKALQSNPSHLRELDLSCNEPGESGVFHLVEGLKVVKCKLQVLKLSNCQLGLQQCQALVGYLKDNPQHLRALDVSINHLGDKGVSLLIDWLKFTPIDKLELYCCQLTEKCCKNIVWCLVDLPSLRELNLSNNNLKNEGVQMLCNSFGLPPSQLEILNLASCGCNLLAKYIMFDSTSLKVLDVSRNHFGDKDVKTFFLFIQTFSLSLETLRLSDCKLTDECCLKLVEALCFNLPNLKELDLSENKLGDSGVKILCRALISPTCKLETLFLACCGITSDGCSSLALALKSNQCNITELSLVRNDTGEEGLRILSAIRDDPRYKLLNLE